MESKGEICDTEMDVDTQSKKIKYAGIRFHPTDEELVGYYLKGKVLGKKIPSDLISEIDIYKYEPWDLGALTDNRSKELFFFCSWNMKHQQRRAHRSSVCGYWKTFGRDKRVECSKCCVGKKRTLVYHRGRAPNGERTDWVMHEYRLEEDTLYLLPHRKGSYLLYKIFNKPLHLPRHDEEPVKSDDLPVSFSEAIYSERIQGAGQLCTAAAAAAVSCALSDMELESDSKSDSSISEVMYMLQILENETYAVSMPNICTAATSSGPSVSGYVHPEVIGNSSLKNDTGEIQKSYCSGDARLMSSNTLTGGQAEANKPEDKVLGQPEIHLESISNSDAWELFCHLVGDVIDSPEITPYAQNVFDKCCYSRLIISAVGRALTGETSAEEWRLAAQIQGSPGRGDKHDSLSPHIKYCYDRLKAHDVKTCFLYCALLLDNENIHVSVLANCFINEGLLNGTTVAAYNRAKDIVAQLIKASLLEANDKTMMVTMYNVIRNSALAILSSSIQGCQIFLRSGLRQLGAEQGDIHSFHRYLIKVDARLKESPPLQEWEQATIIFLMGNKFSSLPSMPSCPTLTSLFLQRNRHLRLIPASFFSSMHTLTNLDLSKTRIRSLPNSLFNLKSLQVLLMRDCEHLITLPSAIGQLTTLQVLDLHGTELIELPDTLGELANLRSLRVSIYGSVNHSEYDNLPTKLIRGAIISSLQLEELGVFVYPGDRRWIVTVSDITKEVTHLMLTTLYFNFCAIENLDYFLQGNQSWKNGVVTKFNFIVGHDFNRTVSLVTRDAESMHSSSERCLRFVNGETIPYQVVEVLKRATSLYLDHHLSIYSLSEFGIDNMDALRICILSDCPKVVTIIHQQEDGKTILPCLEYLSLNSLWNLESIISGHRVAGKGSFDMLKCLWVRNCPKMKFLFTCSMVKILSKLEELVIEDCVSLEHLVIEDDRSYELGVLPCLKLLKLHYLPNLVGFGSSWPSIEYMSFYNCPRLKHLGLTTEDAVNVKEITADEAWWCSLEWDEPVLSARLHHFFTQIQFDDL